MAVLDVDEEIKTHTNESLVLLLAIGPRGWLVCKSRVG